LLVAARPIGDDARPGRYREPGGAYKAGLVNWGGDALYMLRPLAATRLERGDG